MRPYLVDSDVFITAKNRYYAFDLCPGFWDSLIAHHADGRVFSIDRIKSELLFGPKTEDLVVWTKDILPAGFFLPVEVPAVVEKYMEIVAWAQRHHLYTDGAFSRFSSCADGWLVAYAVVNDAIVATNERRAPQSKTSIKIPDVCEAFGADYVDTFGMLRDLGVQFGWPP